MRFKYTEYALDNVLERDHAVLISYDGKLSKRTIITFVCNCGKESSKLGNDLIKKAGAFCKECSLQRGIEKTKRTLKEKLDKDPICTVKSLHETIERDSVVLIKEYTALTTHHN